MDFYLPTRLLTGRGIVKESGAQLAALGRRCLIVTGGSAAKRCGALDDVTTALDGASVAWTVYDGIRPNPSVASCLEGGAAARAFGADFIFGIGGGSPLDAAKAVAVFAANPALDEAGLYGLEWPHPPLPIVLVGTTAGTGSELTQVAVLTASTGRKRSMRHEALYAALALGDPAYTESMPPTLTASTGADALAHALESVFSKTATDLSLAFALQAIRLLVPPLTAVAEGAVPTPEERDTLYRASLLGGMAISITGTVMPHNMSYFLTEQYGVAHGVACAVFLPALLRHALAWDEAETRRRLAAAGTGPEELTGLIKKLAPPPELTLTAAEVEALLPRWENNSSVRKTVGEVTIGEVRGILEELFGA